MLRPWSRIWRSHGHPGIWRPDNGDQYKTKEHRSLAMCRIFLDSPGVQTPDSVFFHFNKTRVSQLYSWTSKSVLRVLSEKCEPWTRLECNNIYQFSFINIILLIIICILTTIIFYLALFCNYFEKLLSVKKDLQRHWRYLIKFNLIH